MVYNVCDISVGYKGKEDPHVNGSMRKFMEDERRKKKEEYSQNSGIIKLQEKLQSEKKVCNTFTKYINLDKTFCD